MNRESMKALGAELGAATREAIAAAVAPLVRRIAELESAQAIAAENMKALSQRAGLEYKGVWSPGTSYVVGDVVTRSGSMWAARRSTDRTPGDGPDSGWTLCVKRGSDAANKSA